MTKPDKTDSFMIMPRNCGRSASLESLKEKLRHIDGIFNTMKPSITNVIFNKPATIIFWSDGTKTVVKAQDGDKFDKEKGLAMAIAKKALGNKGNYYDEIKKWVE